MAENLSNISNAGMNNAYRIVRTEGHRIQNQSAMDVDNLMVVALIMVMTVAMAIFLQMGLLATMGMMAAISLKMMKTKKLHQMII